jgi:RNA polymerase sigma-32 factor
MATTALARVTELDRYIAEINQYPILSAEKEQQLAKQWREHGDVRAAHTLVTSNLRFVVKIAFEYRGYGVRMLDLIQEGSIGLMQAVRRFDPDKGYRLLSYAVYWIRAYIHSFLIKTTRMIKLGTTRAHRKLFFKLRALKGRLTAGGMDNRDDVIDAVAEEMGVDRQDVEEMDQHLSGSDASLDAPIAATGNALVELLPAEEVSHDQMLEEMEQAADQAARLESAIAVLDQRERRIIEARYLTDEPLQLNELGEELGISKQRVYQLERRAVEKLRDTVLNSAA